MSLVSAVKPTLTRLCLTGAAAGAQILASRPAPVPQGMAEDAQAVAAARLHFLRLAIMPHTRTSRRLEDLQASPVQALMCWLSWEVGSFVHVSR